MRVVVVAVVVMAFSVGGCEPKDSGLGSKAAAAKKDEEDKAAAAAAAKAKAEAEAKAAAEAAAAKAEEERLARLADQPSGNIKTTEEIAANEKEAAILEELGRAGTFEKVAKVAKKNRKVYEPLLLKALQHTSANVRTQTARVFIINKWKTEALMAALSEAMLNEAEDIVRENWGVDFRYLIDMEPQRGETITTDLLPAVHKAFTRAQGSGAYSTLGETLMKNRYEPAVADIYKKLEQAARTPDDESATMKIQFLLAALKRYPKEEHKEHIERFLSHSNELVRLRAKEVVESILMMKEAETAAPE